MVQPDVNGILGLLAVATCWSLAVFLFRLSTPGSVARKLSLLLLVEGMTLGSSGFIDLFITDDAYANPAYALWWQTELLIHTFGDCAMLVLYPPFLAAALQTNLTRPFADRRVQSAIIVAAVLLFVAFAIKPLPYAAVALYLALSLLFAFALVASIHAWRIASGAGKARARAFTIAFGVRDVCWGFLYGYAVWSISVGRSEMLEGEPSGFAFLLYALGTLLSAPLIAYGILRTQLFDIDLRIRWTIRQSTLAAAVVTIAYVLSEVAERLVSAELGSTVGILAAALVVFFLAPLQRFAERVADSAMPNTRNTPEYIAFRKMQVYEEAVAEAHVDGGISTKERALLGKLRESLGISAADAESIERDVVRRGETA